ncbi:MAG: hypothetical protein ACREKL_05440 [Chthoniobacterales bacterium]
MCAALLLQTAVAQQATQAVQAQQQAAIGQDVQGGVVNTSAISSESFAPASEADSDIGEQVLLQSAPKYQPFSAWTNWNVFWTSNAQLLNDTQGSDTFLSGALGGGYTPVIAGNLFFDASAEQSIFRYARNGSLDFNSLELNAGLIYVVRPLGDLAVYGHYTYDLLTARGFNKEIYADHTLSVGARKVFTLTRAHLFYASTGASFSLGGEPSYALRDEFSILGGYQLSLTRNMKLDLYYRFAVQPYTQTSRTDLNQLIGGGVSFSVTKWLTVQAISTIGINNSTNSTYSYFAANLGGGVGILVNF